MITTWSDTGNHLWSNAANWDNGVPTSTVDAVISGGGTIIITAGAAAKTVDASGFTGSWDQSGWDIISVYGNLSLGNFTPVDGVVYFSAESSGTLTMNALASYGYCEIDTSSSTAVTITLASNVSLAALTFQRSDAVVAMGSYTLTLAGTTAIVGVTFAGGNHFTWTSGHMALVNGGGDVIQFGGTGTSTHLPPLVISTDFSTPPVLDIASIVATGSLIVGDGSLTVVGAVTLSNSSFSGSWTAFNIGGNLSITGSTTSGTRDYNVTGSAVAHSSTVTNCDFSGGTELNAGDNCIDGGGNLNVDFIGIDIGALTRGFFFLF